MRICLFVLLLTFAGFAGYAQHWERSRTTVPPYGTEKVEAMVKKIQYVEDTVGGDGGTNALTEKKYLSLSLREQFTYHMIHGENYSQNCDGWPPDPKQAQKIYGQLLPPFGEDTWSERQTGYLTHYRDSVMQWIRESIARTGRIGLNYKTALVHIGAVEMIPLLISTYNEKKVDHDILTVLMQLMRDGKYAEFINSASYKKLYAGEDYEHYAAYLVYNTANEELIIHRAMDYYNLRNKK